MMRKAEQKDCLNLAALSMQVWLDTYATQGLRVPISQYVLSTFTEGYFRRLLKEETLDLRVYEQDDHLVGFIVVDLASDFDDSARYGYEITTVYVSRHFQGQGIGRELLEHITCLHGSPFWLSVWVNNEAAISFYRHLGFQDVGETTFELKGEVHSNIVLCQV